jgi:protein SCO1
MRTTPVDASDKTPASTPQPPRAEGTAPRPGGGGGGAPPPKLLFGIFASAPSGAPQGDVGPHRDPPFQANAMAKRIVKAVALLALLALLVPASGPGSGPAAAPQMKLQDYEVGKYAIGGDFTLTNQDGGKSSLSDFRGKAVLLAFGYTHCPDVCPTTLALFKQVRAALGEQASRVQGVFISVDPKRDTPAHLKEYVGYFDPTFVALSGSEAELKRTADHYMAQFRTHESSSAGGYLVDHTAFIYLLDPQGKVRYLFSPDVERAILVQGVRTVLAGTS